MTLRPPLPGEDDAHSLDERLDEALEETFPASDPVAVGRDPVPVEPGAAGVAAAPDTLEVSSGVDRTQTRRAKSLPAVSDTPA